ncbi:hypothetical protein [Streptomyces sp. NPDC002346]
MASRKKHRSRPARRLMAFIDADFAKGGRVTRHQHTKGPESWLVERIGIVWARADDRSLTWSAAWTGQMKSARAVVGPAKRPMLKNA